MMKVKNIKKVNNFYIIFFNYMKHIHIFYNDFKY